MGVGHGHGGGGILVGLADRCHPEEVNLIGSCLAYSRAHFFSVSGVEDSWVIIKQP